MNWLQQNRFLGIFFGALAFATILSAYFLLHEKGAADKEQARLETTMNELTRLRGTTPFPNEENLRRAKAQTNSYRDSLLALENEFESRMFPKPPLQPNEFQAQLRQAATDVIERARASKVQLPEDFNLGFDEYANSLPNGVAAPHLGRQLRAIEWLANTIIDAHVDSLQGLTRSTLPEEKPAPAPARAGTRGGKEPKTVKANARIVDSTSIDIRFSGSSAATRRILNQIAAAKEQAYIIRTLQVRNQADKGPKRGGTEKLVPVAAVVVPPALAGAARKAPEEEISFIVGTEHLNVAAKIEVLRFNFPEMEGR
jgi:hypothetical protein